MSAYPPPQENVPIFDSALFTTNDSQLTISQLKLSFLQFPQAQTATESIPNLAITSSGTAPTAGALSDDGTIATTAWAKAYGGGGIATNIAGGIANQIPYQTAPSTTGFLPVGTSGQVLTANVSGVPTWGAPTADDIAGGLGNEILYQTSASQTGFITAGANGYVLTSSSGVPTWTDLDLDGHYLQFPLAQSAQATIPDLLISVAGHAPTAASSSNDTTIATTAMVQAAIAAAIAAIPSVPVGTITAYGGNTTAPTGWLFCNGATYNNTAYPALQVVLGGAYGSSSTQFNVPNLLGRNAKGAAQTTANYISYSPAGTPSNTIEGGSSTFTTGQMPSHNHGFGGAGYVQTNNGSYVFVEARLGSDPYYSGVDSQSFISTTNDTGSGYEHYEPFVIVQYIIKT